MTSVSLLSIWTSITLNVLCLHAAPLQQADVCAFLADAVVHLTGRTQWHRDEGVLVGFMEEKEFIHRLKTEDC